MYTSLFLIFLSLSLKGVNGVHFDEESNQIFPHTSYKEHQQHKKSRFQNHVKNLKTFYQTGVRI